ncbi:MAG: hypothetical protein ACLFTR_02350 [Candidatus Woesearchaeota archaeon]
MQNEYDRETSHNLDDYVKKRVDEFKDFPTENIVDHAREIAMAYMKEPDMHMNKNDVTWMMTYLQSSEFHDCHDLGKKEISKEYMTTLEFLAKLEYSARFNNNNSIKEDTAKSIERLERYAGCEDLQ